MGGTERSGRLDRSGSEWRDRPAQQRGIRGPGALLPDGSAVNHPKRTIIRGLVLSFGVAVGLISTAGAAWAQEAPSSPPSSDGANVGEALLVERPAPRPDPANELVADPAPVPASTPSAAPDPAPVASPAAAAAPAPTRASAPAAASPARTVIASAAATSPPARATEVQGIQIERSAVPAADAGAPPLAFTGVDNGPLVVLALALLALGAVLVRAARPRP